MYKKIFTNYFLNETDSTLLRFYKTSDKANVNKQSIQTNPKSIVTNRRKSNQYKATHFIIKIQKYNQ